MNPYLATLFIFLLDYRAYTHNSLTPLGILTATLTAIAHAIHPWSIFFTLLGVFFLAGTAVTKVKADVKAGMTVSASNLVGGTGREKGEAEEEVEVGSTALSSGTATGREPFKDKERTTSTQGTSRSKPTSSKTIQPQSKNEKKPPAHPRTSTQVLCNSLPASVCILLHAYLLRSTHITATNSSTSSMSSTPSTLSTTCLPLPTSTPTSPTSASSSISPLNNTPPLQHLLLTLLPYAILSHYASATADTFSSELGILSPTPPVLITSLFTRPFRPKNVARGTNGGTTLYGTVAGVVGAGVMGVVSAVAIPYCGGWSWRGRLVLGVGVTLLGALGSLLDSLLGAAVQGSVIMVEKGAEGRIVENEGGGKVMVEKSELEGGKEYVMQGRDWLSNNGVNLMMCSVMSLVGMGGAWGVGVWVG